MGKILVDAVFFQYNRSGIARVWKSLLDEWASLPFGDRLLVLDREGTAPRIDHLKYRSIPLHSYQHFDKDRVLLQQICDEEGASLLVSSYYTTPLTTPSVFMAYDMIPEVIGWDTQNNAMWQQKHLAIRHASAHIAISRNTADDLCRFFPEIDRAQVAVAHCGVDFQHVGDEAVTRFRATHHIERPYFLLVGSRSTYKNATLFFQAFASLGYERECYAIVCTGPWRSLEPEFAQHVGPGQIHMIEVDDFQLQCAYGGALALAYPSMYEGFGMPITEAMACGCPVITCATGSIPEVAGDAVLYVAPDDVGAMARALHEVQRPDLRADLQAKGRERCRRFSWSSMAREVSLALELTASKQPSKDRHAQGRTTSMAESSLSKIIPGEIVDDEFHELLKQLAIRAELKNFLEIGSSSGAGSTQAFVSSIRTRNDADQVSLYCMELSTERYTRLKAAYADCSFVKVYNQSSVGLSEFPTEQEVRFFYEHTRTNLNQYPLEQVLGWLHRTFNIC